MLNLNDVHMFVQVVKYGGMTAASKATAIPTSTLSKRLSALEESLGVRLVQRTSRAFKVTDLGLDFYRHATAMLIEAESAECVVRGHLTQ
ncbi:LysR family transcriptional regulator [Luteimonas sp. SDU82]|uniref:LysR family transcriptional regulator n=1 Tax=Luteimonas sp. SDU82 TaxID=3422592 RepID=UPI003EB770BF